MGRKRHTPEQIIHKLRQAEVELSRAARNVLLSVCHGARDVHSHLVAADSRLRTIEAIRMPEQNVCAVASCDLLGGPMDESNVLKPGPDTPGV